MKGIGELGSSSDSSACSGFHNCKHGASSIVIGKKTECGKKGIGHNLLANALRSNNMGQTNRTKKG